ncbi:MAG TPA: hypothetical protein VJT71_15535 [Pyrinomonadaceae bacterium]|nr:hypothetical protein [Pyrinomonadaceae bacterium]
MLDQFDEGWALQIVPGYVFTLNGVTKLLEGGKVNKLSTKRASRDYNSQVHNDLVFWSWVMSGGPGSFQLTALPRPRTFSSDASEDEIEAENEVQQLASRLAAPGILFRSQIPTINVTNLPAEANDEAAEELTQREREYPEIEEELAAIAEEQETKTMMGIRETDSSRRYPDSSALASPSQAHAHRASSNSHQ